MFQKTVWHHAIFLCKVVKKTGMLDNYIHRHSCSCVVFLADKKMFMMGYHEILIKFILYSLNKLQKTCLHTTLWNVYTRLRRLEFGE